MDFPLTHQQQRNLRNFVKHNMIQMKKLNVNSEQICYHCCVSNDSNAIFKYIESSTRSTKGGGNHRCPTNGNDIIFINKNGISSK